MDVSLPPQAVEVEARQPFKLWIRFDDGVSGIVDLAQWSTRGNFATWSDVAFFKTAHLRPDGAIAWGKDDNLELDPSAMYSDLTGKCFEDLHPKPWPQLAG
ncbi:DUF2442 domain-containing protein [Candidatus Poriferisodalis sp.]|uniref:DUF2442 domain-containing protein n=1 Tax=Candidatus Poriferisodalis sp. TaxID=3101277 RepID=UPI003D0E7C66